jgi:chemotaxis protein CheD
MDNAVARYFDDQFGLEAAKILPGQYYSARRNIVIVTVLGSCVSACLWDPVAHVGGMNHFMLPGGERSRTGPLNSSMEAARLGIYAMELLINQLLKLGAERRRLVAKVFGGASVLGGMEVLNVGARNGDFVVEFLREEGIPLLATDLYDIVARKVYFFPMSGKVLVRRLNALRNDTLGRREQDLFLQVARATVKSEVEIFTRP